MAKTVNLQEVNSILIPLKNDKKSIVLVGGCFDILHLGHIKFLQAAKKMGDVLFILLENDATVRKLKGKKRPFFIQQQRAQTLSALRNVDYIILLPQMDKDQGDHRIVDKLKPNIIAATENDPCLVKKRQLAKAVGGKIKIIPYLKTFSSSKLVELLKLE